jgi:hypothetical protein
MWQDAADVLNAIPCGGYKTWVQWRKVGTVGGQIKLGHLKFNLCKSDHSIVNIFVSVYIICHTKVNLFVTKP